MLEVVTADEKHVRLELVKQGEKYPVRIDIEDVYGALIFRVDSGHLIIQPISNTQINIRTDWPEG